MDTRGRVNSGIVLATVVCGSLLGASIVSTSSVMVDVTGASVEVVGNSEGSSVATVDNEILFKFLFYLHALKLKILWLTVKVWKLVIH